MRSQKKKKKKKISSWSFSMEATKGCAPLNQREEEKNKEIWYPTHRDSA